MVDFSHQLEVIKTLVHSDTKANKPFAYSTLLDLQEQYTDNPSSIQTLAQSSHSLISPIIADIYNEDEEIAAQALKCLGFMIYHPSIVPVIPVEDANLVVESLAKLIMTTKIKSVCNLGVWCISIQQFDASLLTDHFSSLLRAVVHALDNPIGSLSTTFEAIQAVIKLATQLNEKMRNTSDIWAPPIYRRLISSDKRERDVTERCLLKLKSTIFPPPLNLSKVLTIDIKQKLYPGMEELLNNGKKVQSVQAWGWFIRLLGSHAMKKKRLVNDMLKIPEQTFSDHDPQVQIASAVAWESLIDALIHPPIDTIFYPAVQACETNTALENGIQQTGSSKGNSSGLQIEFSKSLKLIMTPLVGIMSSKCDISVHSSCLNMWCYLLHKLNTTVNHPSVIKAVLEPIFEAVFKTGPDNKSIWLWNLCLDLLDDFILAKRKDVGCDSDNHADNHISARTTMPGKCSWKHFPIKWLPWDLGQLDFHLKMVHLLITQGSTASVPSEYRSLATDAALRIFKSVLKGVRIKLKNPSMNYNEIMSCLNRIVQFLKRLCEGATSEASDVNDLCLTSLWFLEAVAKELEHSVLGSPLYKVAVDLKYIEHLQSVDEIRHAKVVSVSSVAYMDMVTPMVYLTILYFCVVVQSIHSVPRIELILQEMGKYLKYLLSSSDSSENLHVVLGLLYKDMGIGWLKIWITVAKGLKDHIDILKDLSPLKSESDNTGYLAICHLLSYPFVVQFHSPKQPSLAKCSGYSELTVSPVRDFELEHVVEAWKSLYGSVTCAPKFEFSAFNKFSEDLCSILNGFLNETIHTLDSNTKIGLNDRSLADNLLSLNGNAVICVLEQMTTSKGNKIKVDDYCGINNCLRFAARFMKLSWTKRETNQSVALVMTQRVLSVLTQVVGCLHSEKLSFIVIVSDPLLLWLSCVETQYSSTLDQLRLLWTEILASLQKSWPPIIFDSSFLNLQAPLLEKTLNHPNPSISNPTITFWNSTYGQQTKLDYPQCLLHVLDKLSRNGKISLHKRTTPFLKKCNIPQRYRMTAVNNMSSKRVGLVEDEVLSVTKRKRLELTDHQTEVRRAQQGRKRDCSGHGPGVRMYTNADFSQGNDESQESQDIRNSESILEMLRRE